MFLPFLSMRKAKQSKSGAAVMNHNEVLSSLMMMMMDDDVLMVVDVACLLSFGVGEWESLFHPQNA